jgi:hypothetical protein
MDVSQVFGLGFLYPGYVADDDYPLMGDAARGPDGGYTRSPWSIRVLVGRDRLYQRGSKGDLA